MMEKSIEILYEDEKHKFIKFNLDEDSYEGSVISTNQYLIIDDGYGLLIDCGGMILAPQLREAVESFISLKKIKYLFFSHTDPDVIASLLYWTSNTPAKILISSMWVKFLTHFGFLDLARIIPIKDTTNNFHLSNDCSIDIIPAHFLHAPGNYTLYDNNSKILFSGDIGTCITPENDFLGEEFVFEKKIDQIELFHKTYMSSKKASRIWINAVKDLDVNLMVPQHGYVYNNQNYKKFLKWFWNLECGVDLIK